jgi:hypothetical protein
VNKRYLHKVAVVFSTLAAAVTASLAQPGITPAASSRNCPANPKTAPAADIPVWVYLDISTKSGASEPGMGFALRVYNPDGSYAVHGQAWSGCPMVVLFMKGHVPSRICIKVRSPYREPDGPCQAIGVARDGQRVVYFKLTR